MISQFACEGKNPLKPLAIMKKEKAIIIRLTRVDFDRLNALVDITGLSREEFVRRLIAGATIREKPPAEYGEIVRSLHRIGSNIEQILVKARSLGFVDSIMLKEVADKIDELDMMFCSSFSK